MCLCWGEFHVITLKKWPNILLSMYGNFQHYAWRIVWVCLTILWGWRLKSWPFHHCHNFGPSSSFRRKRNESREIIDKHIFLHFSHGFSFKRRTKDAFNVTNHEKNIFQKQKRFSYKFRKIHRKTSVSEPLFK